MRVEAWSSDLITSNLVNVPPYSALDTPREDGLVTTEYKYTGVQDFFLQDSPSANPGAIGAVPSRFGLSPRFSAWSDFKKEVESYAGPGEIKVFWLCRHGQGFHNLAEAKYGTEAWDARWSLLNGDDELTWGPDPLLTNLGKTQAMDLRQGWVTELAQDVPFPERSFCSPLTRALETHDIVFGEQLKKRGKQTLVFENLREHYGEHTCDKRQTLTYLRTSIPEKFPRSGFTFDEGMTEEDELWKPDSREPDEELTARAARAIEQVWQSAEGLKYVSITAHNGFINGILRAIGRTRYILPTGGILPVVIRCV